MEKSIERKNFMWNIIGASTNAFNSLFYAIAVTRINGEFDAGIFIYSFATACLLYFIGNYCGRIFQVTDITGENYDTDYIFKLNNLEKEHTLNLLHSLTSEEIR